MAKSVISLCTGLEDPEKVTVAFLVAVGAAETGRETLMFLTKEAVRLAVPGVARDVVRRLSFAARSARALHAAGGSYYVCPICFNAKRLDASDLIDGAEIKGTIPMWNWIGDEPAVTLQLLKQPLMPSPAILTTPVRAPTARLASTSEQQPGSTSSRPLLAPCTSPWTGRGW